MTGRRELLFAFGLSAFASAYRSYAQRPAKIARIGFLASFSSEQIANRLPGFQQGLRDLGYAEGKNIIIEYRYAAGRNERLPELAAELVRLGVDVLVVQGAPAAHAAKNATKAIPIVMANAADPVGTDRKSTRLNSSHIQKSRMPSSA